MSRLTKILHIDPDYQITYFIGRVAGFYGDTSEIDQIAGKREILLGKIQEKYGIAQEKPKTRLRTGRRPTVDRWFHSELAQGQCKRPDSTRTQNGKSHDS